MKLDRCYLEEELSGKFKDVNIREVSKELYKTHNIPLGISNSILQNQVNMKQYDDFIIYCLTEIIAPSLCEKYFNGKEIKKYEDAKYQEEKIKFPIIFNVKQITNDQWIGSYSVKELMMLRSGGLINYNTNTQRTLEHKIRGGKDVYVISLNNQAVSRIEDAVLNGIFIPNTITLNINEENNDVDFKYSNEEGKLYINSINAFDIIDGFHRYIAFGRIYDRNPNFDYPLEIRVCNYSELKGKQFTYQEDQKTHMKKVDSDSLNQYDNYNIITQKLNEDNMCDFFGEICSGGKIQASHLASALTLYTVKNRKDIINLEKNIREKLNDLIVFKPELLEKTWNEWDTYTAIYGFYREIPYEIIIRTMEYIDKTINSDIKKFFRLYKNLNKSKRIKQYIENCERMVK